MNVNSLLGHCIARSMKSAGATADATPWDAFKASHRASRVCAFVAMWAVAIDELGDDANHTAIQRDLNESRATFFRRLADFRELFPEYDDPTPIAKMLLATVPREELRGRQAMNLELAL